MAHAVLTIDDIASKNTRAFVDYLLEKKIPAIMFAWGKLVEENYENALYAVRNGIIVGNHSYSHPFFSKLTLDEAIAEIEKNEAVLDKLYQDAGVKRVYRPFRFPYGDKGGENKEALQEYFREHGFHKVKDDQIPYPIWKKMGLDKDIDTFWTYDFGEYMIRPGSGVTMEDILRRTEEVDPECGVSLLGDRNGSHLIIIHAHDETEELVPEYYRTLIDLLLDNGFVFDEPQFFT
ncbi:MAG: polysaccharide deacetylase family protein [Clostridiales bacterium]|nr:polysaccharide deacetylase family protein [Clostridiales bacterium]